MPAQPVEFDGLRLTIQDKRWWRRWIPFYTDYFRTSFWIDLERFAPAPPSNTLVGTPLEITVVFSDDRSANAARFALPALAVGEKVRHETSNILISPPGQTTLILGHPQSQFHTLFSYHAVSESAIMASLFALLISSVVLIGTLGGAIIGAQCQPSPVKVVGPVAVVTATLPLTGTATEIPPTARQTP